MTFYIFIDESGGFDEALIERSNGQPGPASLVGGVCGLLDASGWEALHKQTAHDFNTGAGTCFTCPDDLHCSEMIAGKTPGGWLASARQRADFAETIIGQIAGHSAFRFLSRNDPSLFMYSRQATYGVNLVAALRATLDELARNTTTLDSVDITVARRGIGETQPRADRLVQPGNEAYSTDLGRFLEKQLPAGEGPGAALARHLIKAGRWRLRFAAAHANAGLMAADFLCNQAWNRRIDEKTLLVVHADREIFGNYRTFCENSLRRLLDDAQFASAAAYRRRNFPPASADAATDFAPVLARLRDESRPEVLARELPALLGFCRYLVARRTVETGALASARAFLETLISLARRRANQAGPDDGRSLWTDLLVDALAELSACFNHEGSAGGQARTVAELDTVLASRGRLLSRSYFELQDLKLEVKNRNLNRLFNHYAFAEATRDFEKETEEREKSLPPGAEDGLLGQMQGSIGQAYAFLARTDPDWSPTARDWFERSIKHFEPGSLYHAMSVNYLATLAWQKRELDEGCREMSGHPGLRPVKSGAELVSQLNAFVEQPRASAFDTVNYLRLAALGVENGLAIDPPVLEAVAARVIPLLQPQHPHEQVAKWLAYLQYLGGDHAKAAALCRRGVDISEKSGFTVQTIGLSILGLEAVCLRAANGAGAADTALESWVERWRRLGEESAPFRDYLAEIGEGDGTALGRAITEEEKGAAARAVRLLPFTYA